MKNTTFVITLEKIYFYRYFNFPKVLSCLLSHSSICLHIFVKCLLCAVLDAGDILVNKAYFTHAPGNLQSYGRKTNSEQVNKQDVFRE